MLFRPDFTGILAAALLSLWLSPSAMAADKVAADPQGAKAAPPVIKSYGKWSTRCDDSINHPGSKQCHAFIDKAADAKDKAAPKDGRLFYIGVSNVIRKGKPEVMLFITTPLGTILPPGVGIDIGDKVKFGAPIGFCLQLGCQSDMLLSADQINAMKSAKQFHLLFRLIGQGDLKIPISLEGFPKALAALPKAKASANGNGVTNSQPVEHLPMLRKGDE